MKSFICVLFFLHVFFLHETIAYNDLKRRLQASDECRYALQMLFLQDTTHSFKDDWATLQMLLPPFVDDLTTRFPGSESALAFFSDVPMPDLGWHFWDPLDSCFDLQLPFPSTVVNSSAFVDFQNVLDQPRILSGRDEKEAQLTALHHATKASYFPSEQYTPQGHPFVRVVVVSTDSRYHTAGDALAMLQKHADMRKDPKTSWYMPASEFTVVPNNGDEVLQCQGDLIEDYPTVEQVAKSVVETEALVMFLVTDNVFAHYANLADELALYGATSIVVLVRDDATNIVDSLETGLAKVQDLTCQTSSTTSEPITSEPHYVATSTTSPPEEVVPMSVIVGAAVGGTAAVAAAAGAAYAAKAGIFAGAGATPSLPVESLEATDFSHHMEPRTVYQNVELDMYA